MASEHPRPGIEHPSNWHELLAWFPDDAACLWFYRLLEGALAAEPQPYKALTGKSAA